MNKLFLIGYYGYQNIGDEVLLSAISGYLKTQGHYDLSVLSYCAQETEAIHKVKAVSRSKGMSLLLNIFKTDAIISGGGSILQDTTSSKSLYYYAGILLLGKLFRKKVYLVGNGYGPVHKKGNQLLLRWLLPKLDGVIARDQQAYQAFKSYGVSRLVNGVDCVFLKKNLTDGVGQSGNAIDKSMHYMVEAAGERPYVGISLRPWAQSDHVIEVLKEAVILLNQLGYDTVMIPMKAPDDVVISEGLLKLGPFVRLASCDGKEISDAIGGSAFVIGMRLHALILAAISHRPFIAISYDPKVTAFTEQVSQTLAGLTENMTQESMLGAIHEMHLHLEEHRRVLVERVQVIQRQAVSQMETLVDWLKQDSK